MVVVLCVRFLPPPRLKAGLRLAQALEAAAKFGDCLRVFRVAKPFLWPPPFAEVVVVGRTTP